MSLILRMPTDAEVRNYSNTRLMANIRQHEQNIKKFEEIIKEEKMRIEWLENIMSRKEELEKGGN